VNKENYEAALKEEIAKVTAPTYCDVFDRSIKQLNDGRGADYDGGSPSSNFRRMSLGYELVKDCKDPELQQAMYMIIAKVSRLVQSPTHRDSILDIAGYARNMCMIIDERRVLASRERTKE